LATGIAACGQGGGSDSYELARPTTTHGGIAITQQAPEFHIGVGLEFPGSTIQIIDVQAHTSPNVDFLGAVAVWPRDIKKFNVGAGTGYPPPNVKGSHPISEPVPATETLFAPKGFGGPGEVSVAAGFKLREGEIGAMNGIRIIYEVDGKRMTEDSAQAGIACLPKSCDRPDGSDTTDFNTRILREAGLLPKDS
jgi:hypothetical protein